MVNYVKVTNYRKTFQNKIFPKLNSKKHTPSPTVWVLRNCGIAQNLSFAKAEKGNFARNDFYEWLRKLLFFFRAKKEKFCASFRKNCAKVLRMETLCRSKHKRCVLTGKTKLNEVFINSLNMINVIEKHEKWEMTLNC